MLLWTENVTWHHQCEVDKDIPNCILRLIRNDSRENHIFALFALLKHAPYKRDFSQFNRFSRFFLIKGENSIFTTIISGECKNTVANFFVKLTLVVSSSIFDPLEHVENSVVDNDYRPKTPSGTVHV